MDTPVGFPEAESASRAAMTGVLDAELQPDGASVDLAELFARAVLAGAVAVKDVVGDSDVDELAGAIAAAVPTIGFDWADALWEGFPDEPDELLDDVEEAIDYGDGVLDSLIGEFLGTPKWVGGVSPNPYSRMACSLDVWAVAWKDGVWFYETGDFDGMDRYYARYAHAVGDASGEAAALCDIASEWAGGELCDHPDPTVRRTARRAYLDRKLEAPWEDPGSGFDELIAGDADDLVASYGPQLAAAMKITAEEAKRLIRSIKAHGPGDNPDLDNTEAALELWWLTDNWTTWWGR